MKHAALDLKQIQRRMHDIDARQENIAVYLGIGQSTLSKKLRGKTAFTYQEGIQLVFLLGWDIVKNGEQMTLELQQAEPAADAVKRVLVALSDEDRHDCYMMFTWIMEGKIARLKPEGRDAYRELKALA